MAGSKVEYSQKRASDEVAVDACKGWFDVCEFCDKRFGKWLPLEDEVLEKFPDKRGFFMVALENKNVTEVVSILYSDRNLQTPAYTTLDSIKEQISNKKSKATKSTILVRWMEFKKANEKETVVLCAHWYNNGVMPKFLTSWPGLNVLENTDTLAFSKTLQKWCYPKKNPTWKKPKQPSSKIVEVVPECNWLEKCKICDSYFTEWNSYLDVLDGETLRDEMGLYMIAVRVGKKREIVHIGHDSRNTTVSLRDQIKSNRFWVRSFLRNSKFVNKNAFLEIRWMVLKNVNTDNSCLLFAHFYNAGSTPMFSSTLPGQNALEMNRHFVCRTDDRKWCYETETFKQSKISKAKNKKNILDEIEAEYIEM